MFRLLRFSVLEIYFALKILSIKTYLKFCDCCEYIEDERFCCDTSFGRINLKIVSNFSFGEFHSVYCDCWLQIGFVLEDLIRILGDLYQSYS